MENILVVGVNTRAVACSVKKLGYKVYSADYFGTMDLRSCADGVESVLDQEPQISCGKFTQRFNPHNIEEMALEMVDNVDGIICCAGASPNKFPSQKIIGNPAVDGIKDKYSLYKKLEGYFNFPETYLVKDIDDVRDITHNSPEKKFILKPRSGSGGYGVRTISSLDFESDSANINNYILFGGESEHKEGILQEYIQGENISASVLSTKDDAQTILTSRQIIGDVGMGQMEPFGYCGNIVPYTGNSKISETAQKVVAHLSLLGSNGVDFITRNGEVYIIEVNPRLQGTFECAEMALDINMAEAHIKACQGQLMKISPPQRFAVKMIIHAKQRSQVGNLNMDGLNDIPHQGVIIEKGEPMATVLTSSHIKEDAIHMAREKINLVYKLVKPAI